jgi:16S rRNA (cytosine967-C5)-methyltransferase
MSARRRFPSPRPTPSPAPQPSPVPSAALLATARGIALQSLLAADESRRFATDLLDDLLRDGALSGRDRGLATELVYGVIRRQGTLSTCLRPHLSRNWDELEPGLRWLLSLGAYQLLFCDAIPPHAAVHETVGLASVAGQPRWTGFANAVLRALAQAALSESSTSPARNAVPVANGTYRLLATAPFPDPAIDAAGYLSAGYGMPRWLVDRWLTRRSHDETRDLLDWFNRPVPLSLRVNRLKTTRDELIARFEVAGLTEVERSTDDDAILRLSAPGGIAALPGFHEGLFAVQDESALAAARLLAPKPGERILDLCAAPGGKTAALAELADDRTEIIACDIDHERLKLVAQTAARLGLTSIRVQPVLSDLRNVPAGPFDAILLDVPCSNTGVLGKRPEARHRLTPQDLIELPAIQRRIVDVALERLKPGGRLVYSTCSIEPEENDDLVAAVLRDHPDLTLAASRQHTPGQPGDGAYQALLVKRS